MRVSRGHFFNFHPRLEILSKMWSRDYPDKNQDSIDISAQELKFKNRYGAPKSIPPRHPQPKYEQNRPGGLGCRGGVLRLSGLLIL